MIRVAIAALGVATLALAGWVDERIGQGLHPRPEFHHMRYCANPPGTMPMHPCAEIDDPNEVVPL
jgi:hypothetical protein